MIQKNVSVTEASASFGLKSGVEYPLDLGSRFSGTSGEISGGSFRIHGEFRPATAIFIEFENGDYSDILELQTSQITFRQSDVDEPSMAITLHNGLYAFVHNNSPCQFVFYNLFPECQRETSVDTVVLSDQARRKGLAPIVQDNLESAVITLSPEALQELLDSP